MGAISLSVIVLAAGKGTRMKSSKAKVLHHVFYKPMICHVLDSLANLHPQEVVVVTGHQYQKVEGSISKYSVSFARQTEQLGTGHAVLAARDSLNKPNKQDGVVLIVCGDTPLLRPSTLQQMVESHRSSASQLTVMSTIMDEPANYGRVISDLDGNLLKIVEDKDASPEQRQVQEVNAGIYCVDQTFLFEALEQVGTDNKQGEVYLTDIVEIAKKQDLSVGKFLCDDSLEITGVNSRVELALATNVMQKRRNHDLMMSGVSMIDPDTVFVEGTANIGQDTVIHPNCQIMGSTVVGKGCTVESFSILVDCQIGDNVTVEPFTSLTNANME